MENDSTTNEERVEFPEYEKTAVPRGMEDKTVQLLRSKRLIGTISSKKMFTGVTLLFLLFAGIFYTGWIIGKNDKSKLSVAVSTEKSNDFLLLLYNTPGFAESKAHAKEYGDWMQSLIKNNHIATGEELKKEGWQLSMPGEEFSVNNQPVQTDKGRISGFFLIKAGDDKKALEIALSCPHIKHKGMIELRPVRSY